MEKYTEILTNYQMFTQGLGQFKKLQNLCKNLRKFLKNIKKISRIFNEFNQFKYTV